MFSCFNEVRQGRLLSSLLFTLFLNNSDPFLGKFHQGLMSVTGMIAYSTDDFQVCHLNLFVSEVNNSKTKITEFIRYKRKKTKLKVVWYLCRFIIP